MPIRLTTTSSLDICKYAVKNLSGFLFTGFQSFLRFELLVDIDTEDVPCDCGRFRLEVLPSVCIIMLTESPDRIEGFPLLYASLPRFLGIFDEAAIETLQPSGP